MLEEDFAKEVSDRGAFADSRDDASSYFACKDFKELDRLCNGALTSGHVNVILVQGGGDGTKLANKGVRSTSGWAFRIIGPALGRSFSKAFTIITLIVEGPHEPTHFNNLLRPDIEMFKRLAPSGDCALLAPYSQPLACLPSRCTHMSPC